MARKRNKIQAKHLNTAARLRKNRNRKLAVMLVALGVALAILAVYFVLVSNALFTLTEVSSLLVWLFFAITAALVGWYGNRYSRASTDYKKYLNEYEIPDEEVKKYMQSHRL